VSEEDIPADLQAPLASLLDHPPPAAAAPDRFVYTLRRGDEQITFGEKALDADGRRLMQWLLNTSSGG